MTDCARCAIIPDSPNPYGTLFLSPPLAHTQATLRRMLQGQGIEYQELASKILSVALVPGLLENVLTALAEGLSESERRDTRSLILGEGAKLTLKDMLNTQPLTTLIAKVQERWLADMIRDRRLTTHFQPIVRADDPSEVYAHECLLRGRMDDGSLMTPIRMYDAARDADLLFQLDRAARLTAIREAVHHRVRERLFINFNPSSIYDPTYCLKSTISAIDSAGIAPDRIVFEVVESDQVDVDLLGIMTTYRRAGFRVALDDLGAGYGSLNLLSSLQPDFVKLDMRLVRDVDTDRYKAGITSKLLEMAQKLGIATIAEGIETPGELAWFREHRADYVQGFYIARPSSPPPRPFSDRKGHPLAVNEAPFASAKTTG